MGLLVPGGGGFHGGVRRMFRDHVCLIAGYSLSALAAPDDFACCFLLRYKHRDAYSGWQKIDTDLIMIRDILLPRRSMISILLQSADIVRRPQYQFRDHQAA